MRKCYPNVSIMNSIEDVEVGDDVVGIYFVYPGDRDRFFKQLLPGGLFQISVNFNAFDWLLSLQFDSNRTNLIETKSLYGLSRIF